MYKVVLTIMMVFVSQCVFSQQVKEVTPTKSFCSKASSISKGLAEYVASRMSVSISSIKLIRATDRATQKPHFFALLSQTQNPLYHNSCFSSTSVT